MTETQEQQAKKRLAGYIATLDKIARDARLTYCGNSACDKPNCILSREESEACEIAIVVLRSQVQTERTPEVQKAKEQLEAQFELMRLADTDTEWRLETLRRSYRSAIDCLVDAVLRSAPALTQGEHDSGASLAADDAERAIVPTDRQA